MGCDIHMWAETRNKKNKNWELVSKKVFTNDWYSEDMPKSKYNQPKTACPYNGRNYELFALLADVRNNYEIEPIAQPKGVPDDASPEYKEIADEYDLDGHSYSFFTLKELQDYDWTKKLKLEGVVGVEEFKTFLEKGKPDSYSRGSYSQHETVTNYDMRDYVNSPFRMSQSPDIDRKKTVVQWYELYSEMAGKFYTRALTELAKLGGPEDVRIVFFFDN